MVLKYCKKKNGKQTWYFNLQIYTTIKILKQIWLKYLFVNVEIIIIFKLQIQKTRLFPLRYLKSYLQ